MKKIFMIIISIILTSGLLSCRDLDTIKGTITGATSKADIGVISFTLQSNSSSITFLLTDETYIKSQTNKFSAMDFKKCNPSNIVVEVNYNKEEIATVDENGKDIIAYNAYKITIVDVLTEDYKLKSNVIYYVLNDEYLDNNENDTSKLVMEFMCYDGVKDTIYPYTNVVILDKVNTIEESRIKLFKESPNELRLPDNTIVSENVLSKWKKQNYDGIYSYTDTSPKGLSY